MDLRNFIIVLLAGVIAGLLFFNTCNKPVPPAPVVVAPAKQEKQIVKYVDNYKKSFDSLKVRYADLSKNAVTYKNKLDQERQKSKMMEKVINDLPASNEQKTAINDYFQNNQEISSSTDSLIRVKDSSLAVKDQMLAAKELLNSQLRISLDTCIKDKTALLDYSETLQGKLKWQKGGNKFWRGVAIVVSIILLQQKLK